MRMTAGTLPMVLEVASVSGVITASRSGSSPCAASHCKPVLRQAGLGEGRGDAEQAGEEQQQMPVDGADHLARRQAARQEQHAGDGERAQARAAGRQEERDQRERPRRSPLPSGSDRASAAGRPVAAFRAPRASRQVASDRNDR